MCEICDGKSPEQARQELLAAVSRHDYAVVSVEHERTERRVKPGWCYTVGLWEFCRRPELVVVGAGERAMEWIERYAARARAGERFKPGTIDHEIIPGYPVLLQRVARAHYTRWLTQAAHLYPTAAFQAVQLVWPSSDLTWPWESAWPHPEPQPLLTSNGLPDYGLRRVLNR